MKKLILGLLMFSTFSNAEMIPEGTYKQTSVEPSDWEDCASCTITIKKETPHIIKWTSNNAVIGYAVYDEKSDSYSGVSEWKEGHGDRYANEVFYVKIYCDKKTITMDVKSSKTGRKHSLSFINYPSQEEADLGLKFWQEKKWKESAKWNLKAAKHGNMYGQKRTGLHFQRGLGVQKDYIEAVHWHRLAAKQGDCYSMMNLGIIYKTGGYGVQKDLNKALKWLLKAKESCKNKQELKDINILIKTLKQ